MNSSTRLSIFCDKVIEAGWLAAIIVAPLFFNVYSSRVFEPDKLTLVRSIALVMAGAWLVKLLETRKTRSQLPALSTPLVLPTLFLMGIYIISTAASIVPHISLFGSYQRLQGTYTTFSYIVIFFLVLQGLRTREQLRRLVSVAILTSLPISIYGIIQRYRLDPLPWGGDVSARVASNMGNSIFVAAYIIMVFPLTLGRVVESFSSILAEEKKVLSEIVLASCYIFIAAVEIICIIFTQSRGPMLGLIAGVFFFVLILAVVRGKKWIAWAAIGTALSLFLFLVVLNLPSTPLEFVKDIPYVGRFGRVFETDRGTGKVRVLIWEGAAKLVSFHPPIEYPSGEPDKLNLLRSLIGYGPESMWVAFNRFYPPDLAHVESRTASPDRSHNETFDALVITGFIGFIVYMFLFASVFYYGFKWLGLIEDVIQHNAFICLWIGSGLAGAIFFWIWKGVEFIGVGLPFGITLGLCAYLVMYTLIFYKASAKEERASPLQILLISLVSGVMAHFVEIHFGIAIAATRTYFWVYTALMVVVGYFLLKEPEILKEAPIKRRSRRKRRKRRVRQAKGRIPSQIIPPALLMSLILLTMGFDYITNAQRRTDAPSIIWLALTTLVRGKTLAKSYAMLYLFAITWLVGGAVFIAELNKSRRWVGWQRALFLYLSISLGFSLLFFLAHASKLGKLVEQMEFLKMAESVADVLPLYYLFTFTLMALLGISLMRGIKMPALLCRAWAVPLHLLLLFIVVSLISFTNMRIIKADIVYKQAQPYDNARQWDASIAIYRRALELAPREDFYYLFLGRAYLEKAKATSDSKQRNALLELSRGVLEKARSINPLNTDHSANLARLYRTWAELTPDPDERAEKIEIALEYYRQATNLSPNAAHLFNEWAQAHILKGDYEGAMAKLERSLELDKKFDQTYLILGDLHRARNETEKAISAYEEAVKINPKSIHAHSVLSVLYAQTGRFEEAVRENLAVIELNPRDYVSHKNLAILYRDMGRIEDAISEATKALELAPEKEKGGLEAFIAQLKGELSRAELVQTYLSQGQSYLAERDWDKAEEVYLKVLELDPNSLQAHSALGYVYAQTGRLEEAVEENLAVIALDPNDYISRKNLAILYRQLGRIDEAIAQALIARDLAPENERKAVDAFIAELKEEKLKEEKGD